MDWGSPFFVIAIIAVCGAIALARNWIQAKHGYELDDERGNKSKKLGTPEADRKIELLTSENEGLKGQVTRLEDRISVLERIATDKSSRLSDEIDALGREAR